MVSSAPMQTAFAGEIPMRGDLRICVRHAATGLVKWNYEIRNTITYRALGALVNLLAQKSTTTADEHRVRYIRFGGYPTGFPVAAVPPTRADTNLTLPLPSAPTAYTIVLGDAEKTLTLSGPYEMKLVATLGAGDLNGYDLHEAGLFTQGTVVVQPPGEYPPASLRYPELFARQIHPVIQKTAAFVVDYDWRISFTS